MRQVTIVRRWFVLATACGIATIGLCPQAQGTPLEALSSPSTQTNSDLNAGSDYTIGYLFQVGSTPLSVTSLGIWDPTSPVSEGFGGSGTGTGFADSHEIGLWTTGGSLLASATVPAGTTAGETSDGYLFAANTPVTLAANADYVIGFNKDGSDENHSNVSGPVFNTPYVSLVNSAYTLSGNSPSGTLTFPAYNNSPYNAWDPNFQFTPLPEPSSVVLLGFAGVGLLFCALRRRAG